MLELTTCWVNFGINVKIPSRLESVAQLISEPPICVSSQETRQMEILHCKYVYEELRLTEYRYLKIHKTNELTNLSAEKLST